MVKYKNTPNKNIVFEWLLSSSLRLLFFFLKLEIFKLYYSCAGGLLLCLIGLRSGLYSLMKVSVRTLELLLLPFIHNIPGL